ncbi:MAG: hypothetical protein IT214_10155 [Chitinophagaceae bacterium]|jgi:hypothetical protein|nr:hypothetical protein [Chitinophagaceae bacterium]OQY93069.1 MAG: hypothetical protein B6D37_12395 [Sphingobacteriales bacterium UTBCD1]
MKKQILSLLILFFANGISAAAQDTLPDFSVRNVSNNRIIIGWNNTFPVVKQISIQRSFDSITGFKTILTVPDPTAPQNGYLDTKATNDHLFYRLYILLDKGNFLFSAAKKPVADSSYIKHLADSKQKTIADSLAWLKKIDFGGKTELITGKDSSDLANQALQTKKKPDVFIPSKYVSTFKTGYVHVNLPDDGKKYSIRFFEEDGTFLFELKDIKEKKFSIDKSNFYHAGWFNFELYGNGELIEKHKFYLQKEF